jgi:hypothetical protein
MSSHEAPTTSTTKSIMWLASETGTVMSPSVENAAWKDIDPSTDSHVSSQPSPKRLSPIVRNLDLSAPPSTDEELPAVPKPAATTNDGAAVTVNNAVVTSGTPKVEIGAKSLFEVVKKVDAPERQDEGSIATEDKTPGSTEATTHDTTNS